MVSGRVRSVGGWEWGFGLVCGAFGMLTFARLSGNGWKRIGKLGGSGGDWVGWMSRLARRWVDGLEMMGGGKFVLFSLQC